MGSYKFPTVEPDWCERRETHPAVGAAIHAIAGRRRNAHAIWADPTAAELGDISKAIEEFVNRGLVKPAPRGVYLWGCDTILVPTTH